MKISSRIALGLMALQSLPAWAIQAQPVPIPEELSVAPQVNVSGVGVGTGVFGRSAEQTGAKAGVDFSDSTLQIGAAQRLYNQSVGSMGFGLLALGNEGRPGDNPLFLSQAFVDLQSESFELLIGRSDNPTSHLVDFPTLRDDDLVTLTNPLNPRSNGEFAQDHRYSDTASVTFNQGLRFFENFHAQQLIDSAEIGPHAAVTSFGATFQYLASPGLEAFSRFPTWGFGWEHLTPVGSADQGLNQIYAGGVLNLNTSVTDRIDLRVQDIVSLGSDLHGFADLRETFEADSNSVALAIRYLHSPFGRPGSQISLTGGYKTYFKVAGARSVGGAITGVKRLGEGFDLVAQYLGQWREESLRAAQSNGLAYEQVAQIGFIFSFDATFNRHISPRRSLLNQGYRYIPN